jgi:hypothetical protein
MVSTPNAPDGLFERIEREIDETCIYKRLKLDYTYGLDRIYTREEIEKAKQSPSFERGLRIQNRIEHRLMFVQCVWSKCRNRIFYYKPYGCRRRTEGKL